MRKFGLILAGAALLELAAVVAAGHASTPVGGYYLTPVGPLGITASACALNGGVVLHKANSQFCQTAAPAKPDDLHVRKAGGTQPQFLAAPTAPKTAPSGPTH